MNERQKLAVLDIMNRFLKDGDSLNIADDVHLVLEVRSLGSTRRLRYRDAKGRRRVFTRTIPNRPKPAADRRLESLVVNPDDLYRLDQMLEEDQN